MAFNLGRAIQGSLAGAGSGAMLGSSFPGLGTGIGTVGGGVLGFLSSLFGNGQDAAQQSANMSSLNNQGMQTIPGMQGNLEGQVGRIPLFNQQQQALQEQLQQLASSRLQQLFGGGPSAGENVALRQFGEQIVPGIAERFSGLGAGAQRSSAFAQQLGAAGSGLAERLSAMREQQQNQFLPSLLQGSMQPQFETIFQPQQPEQPGFFRSIAPGLASGLGMGAGAGALYGAQRLLGGG